MWPQKLSHRNKIIQILTRAVSGIFRTLTCAMRNYPKPLSQGCNVSLITYFSSVPVNCLWEELCSRENWKKLSVSSTSLLSFTAPGLLSHSSYLIPLPPPPLLLHFRCDYSHLLLFLLLLLYIVFPRAASLCLCFLLSDCVYLSNMFQMTNSDKAVDASLNCSSSETHYLAIHTKLVHCVSAFWPKYL